MYIAVDVGEFCRHPGNISWEVHSASSEGQPQLVYDVLNLVFISLEATLPRCLNSLLSG